MSYKCTQGSVAWLACLSGVLVTVKERPVP
jgi:hypothetical protein